MWSWLQALRCSVARADERSLRAVVTPGGPPYRQDAATTELEPERTTEPATLAQVLAALEAAGLRYHRRRAGFDILGPGRRAMPVRVRDADRITPADMRCGTQAPELLLDLALALVPVFGPLRADVRYAGSILVDGRRDRRELGEDAARAIQQFGLRLAPHVPMVFPLLVDLARRMRNSSAP